MTGRTDDAMRARWAVEDAWRKALVMKRWTAFARLLTAAQCETVLAKATAKGRNQGCPWYEDRNSTWWNSPTPLDAACDQAYQSSPAAAAGRAAQQAALQSFRLHLLVFADGLRHDHSLQ